MDDPLEQKFETQVKRRLHCHTLASSLIEAAIDEGFILPATAGNR
jgi:hypothetical protein